MDLNLIDWQSLSKNSYNALFRTVDDYPISFYFHLDDYDVKKRFEELVKTYGGDIVEKYNDMSPYTALMVEDGGHVSASSNRVSFRASYIIECVNDRILLNINFYIQTNNLAKFKDHDYMKVIYLRESTFTADQIGISCGSSDSVNVSKPVKSNKLTTSRDKPYQSNMNRNRKLNRNAGGSISFAENHRNKKCALSFNNSNEEESDFRTSIISSPGFDSIEKPDGKTTENKCLNPCSHCILHMDRRTLESIIAKTRNETSRDITKRNHRKNSVELECNVSENELNPRRTHCKKLKIRCDDCNDSHFSSSDESLSDECPRIKNGARISSDDEDCIGPPVIGIPQVIDFKHSRYPYCREEKEAILRYIVDKEAYHNVGGANLWKQMELSNICPRRTWMSLQNHFKRSLIKELHTFKFLTKYQIELLRGY